jgi:hypothetical protein
MFYVLYIHLMIQRATCCVDTYHIWLPSLDNVGMLSFDEIKCFTGFPSMPEQIQFTDTAWKHFLEEYVSYQPFELDYKGFVNLVLAVENLATPESINYFWRVLDIDKSGRLTVAKIKHFYSDVRNSLIALNYDAPVVEHVVLEIFDMLSVNSATGATCEDLIRSKQGHTVVTMLLDVNGFWRYDNRESLMSNGASTPTAGDGSSEALPPVSDGEVSLAAIGHNESAISPTSPDKDGHQTHYNANVSGYNSESPSSSTNSSFEHSSGDDASMSHSARRSLPSAMAAAGVGSGLEHRISGSSSSLVVLLDHDGAGKHMQHHLPAYEGAEQHVPALEAAAAIAHYHTASSSTTTTLLVATAARK